MKKLSDIPNIDKPREKMASAFELAKRYLLKEERKIQNTDDVLALVQDIRDKKQEYFLTITLTGASAFCFC